MDITPPHFTSAPPIARPAPKWPKILGIIAVVFGAGGLLQGAFVPVSLAITRTQMRALAEPGTDEARVNSYLEMLTSISIYSAIASAILGAILLVGGILIIRHRRTGSPVLQIWAFLKIFIGGYLLFRSSALTRVQMELMMPTDSPGSSQEAEMITNVTTYFMWVATAFGLLWLIALPVFFLVWFNRSRIREDLAAW